MATHNELGKRGERIACAELRAKGYRILACNYRLGRNEIDIIAKPNPNLVVFVEVKTRGQYFIVSPEKSVSILKQKRIIKIAHYFMRHFDLDCEVRFDILTIILRGNESHINHIENAFSPIW